MFGKSVDTNIEKINNLFDKRYVQAIFPSAERAREMLSSGRRLRFYLGIDPTGPDIHLGHSTNLFVLKKLINMGHEVILLIGDFTALIGDPTGKDKARKALSSEEIKNNMKTYLSQIYHILPKGSFKVKYNSEWLGNLVFKDVIELASHFTHQQMIIRDMFQERIKAGRPIFLNEFLYPLAQGYDSVAMDVDGEMGGNDQTFNMLVGRTLEKEILKKDKIVITTWLLEDPVTKKKIMSKSEGKYISFNDSPDDMFGKVMTMNDSAVIPLFEYTTEVPISKIDGEIFERFKANPMSAKKELAFELIKIHYGEKEATKARDEWDKVFSKREMPSEIETVSGAHQIATTFVAGTMRVSNTEAKRLLDQGAVKVNDVIIKDWGYELKAGDVVQIGPKTFVKIK